MSKRSKNIEGKIGSFLKQYTRKAQSGQEPNDRQYDRKVEAKIKQMSPEQLSELMSGEGEVDLELEEKWLRAVPLEGVQYLPNASVKMVKGPYIRSSGRNQVIG